MTTPHPHHGDAGRMSERTTVRYEPQEWSFLDKSAWPRGQWDREPDKVQWVDEDTGLDCLLHRNGGGAWCGYVGVAEGHALFGIGYNQCTLAEPCDEVFCEHRPESSFEVHGGLTYSDFCQHAADGSELPPGRGICHIPYTGRPDRVWWLGFDCAHFGDRSPAYDFNGWDDWYKDRRYATQEVTRLAQQLHAYPAKVHNDDE